MTYANPNSHWVAGFGRLYLPWATSLDTLDGGYFGRRIGQSTTVGVFGGSTPDPTSWDYNPNRHIGGAFVNFEGGDFAATHYSLTLGGGASSISGWRPDRPFVFTDASVSYKNYLTIYESLMADRPAIPTAASSGMGTATMTNTAGIARSFLTVNLQPARRFAVDVNYNYFRDYPTFDLNLVSTGLVDKLLFQGLSAGTRIEIARHITFYNNFGRSSASSDTRASWNQMYGITVDPIWRTGLRGDVHYSTFASPYATGHYESFSMSHSFGENLRWEGTIGKQSLWSRYTRNTTYTGFGTLLDWTPGRNLFLDLNFNLQRGVTQNYAQWFLTIGYRFDSHPAGKIAAFKKK
jgi:hypothetical protein